MIIGIDASRAFGNFFGGPESYSYNLIRSILLAKTNHTFRLYVTAEGVKNPRFDQFKAVLAKFSIFNFQFSIIRWPRLWTQVGLAFECLKNPPDVLFIPAHTLPIVRRPSLPTVVTIHDLGARFLPNYHKFPQKYYLNSMTDYAIKNATKIITVSNYTKADISKQFKVENGKLKVIYEGYDRDVFYPRSEAEIDAVKSQFGITGDYFLFVGTIQPRKNLVRLIEAFSQLSIVNCQLLIVGSPGWLNREIYQAPQKFGVEARVKFLGHVENELLAALYSGARAFVFPSLFEGFGLAPLEAMACGAPVILSHSSSLPEVGGEAAFYVDPHSTEEIVQKMKQVLALSKEARGQLIEEVKAQAAKFSWEKAAAETLAVIESAFEILQGHALQMPL